MCTVHWGDQAWKPASCTLLWDSNPQVGLTHVYTSIWESAAALQQTVPHPSLSQNWGKYKRYTENKLQTGKCKSNCINNHITVNRLNTQN